MILNIIVKSIIWTIMKNLIYLIGNMSINFVGKKLSTVKEVVSNFFYQHTHAEKAIKESS